MKAQPALAAAASNAVATDRDAADCSLPMGNAFHPSCSLRISVVARSAVVTLKPASPKGAGLAIFSIVVSFVKAITAR